MKVSIAGDGTVLKNLVTGETLKGQLPPSSRNWTERNNPSELRATFKIHLEPHSYAVFEREK